MTVTLSPYILRKIGPKFAEHEHTDDSHRLSSSLYCDILDWLPCKSKSGMTTPVKHFQSLSTSAFRCVLCPAHGQLGLGQWACQTWKLPVWRQHASNINYYIYISIYLSIYLSVCVFSSNRLNTFLWQSLAVSFTSPFGDSLTPLESVGCKFVRLQASPA